MSEPLQSNVSLYPSKGFPGQAVSLSKGFFTAENYVSDGTVEAGQFAFLKNGVDDVKNMATKAQASGKLLGFVVRSLSSPGLQVPFSQFSNAYAMGQGLNIALTGQYYFLVPSGTPPTNGQHVLCNPDDGAITFGDKGSPNDTGWSVTIPDGNDSCEEGDIVIIQKLGE